MPLPYRKYERVSGFSALLNDLRHEADAHANALARDRAETADLISRLQSPGNIVKAYAPLLAELEVMAKAAVVTAREIAVQRRADGRQRFEELKSEADAAVAAGMISGQEGYLLDEMISRVARIFEHD
jgi:hypothetical protein